METNENANNERLQRAIKCLQLIQRTNPQKATIAKAAAKAIVPLLAEAESRPLPPARSRKAKAVPVISVDPRLQADLPADMLRTPQIDPDGNYRSADTEGLKVGAGG